MLAEEPYKRLDVPLDAYLQNGSNYETVRLIALSDRVLGRDENYDVLFDSALEAIREHPGVLHAGCRQHVLAVPASTSAAGGHRSARSDRPRAPAADLRARRCRASRTRRRRSSSSVSHTASSGARPTTSTRARSRIPSLVWCDPAKQRRYREIVSKVRAWDAELPSRTGVSFVPEILNRITPDSRDRRSGSRSVSSRSRGGRPRVGGRFSSSGSAPFLVLLIHAASQGVAPEFALPVYPMFIVTALGALAGERGACGGGR